MANRFELTNVKQIHKVMIMNDLLFAYLMKFKKKELIQILWASVGVMEGYNGQSKTEAIMSAIGAESVEKDEQQQWKMPSIQEAAGNAAGFM